jgi:hypothetical protein
VPWRFADLQKYQVLWDAFIPARCAKALPNSPWECMFAVASYSTLATPVYIMEAQTDRVVMPLHASLPDVYDNSNVTARQCDNNITDCPAPILSFMDTWRSQMVKALQIVIDRKNGDGIFNPACLIHTGFELGKPLLHGKNYLTGFTDWLFQRSPSTVIMMDDCGVMCNPTCSGLSVHLSQPHEESM